MSSSAKANPGIKSIDGYTAAGVEMKSRPLHIYTKAALKIIAKG
jgi:hypothetical protein